MQITLSYGGNEINLNVADGMTVGNVKGNANYQAVLGFAGQSVDAVVDGVMQADAITLRDGDSVLFQTRAATKGA